VGEETRREGRMNPPGRSSLLSLAHKAKEIGSRLGEHSSSGQEEVIQPEEGLPGHNLSPGQEGVQECLALSQGSPCGRV
jgi:hypothetical protein